MLIPHDHITILDGAMGTMLQAAGLPLGKYPEALNLTHSADITAIHRAYAQAGAQILYANTFGANRRKLEGSGLSPREVIQAGIACARACRSLLRPDRCAAGTERKPSV